MNNLNFDTPIALMFFNRPDTLKQVFESVKNVKPRKIFLVQDGPRLGNENDIHKINSCRKIVDDIDWECDIYRNFSKTNLGVANRMSTGISWVFEYVEKAIILEDDCLPNLSFFYFCQELLIKYENDLRIGLISGFNYFNHFNFGGYSYGFVKSGGIWGWATWKNRWVKYDFEMSYMNNSYLIGLIHEDIGHKSMSKHRVNDWRGRHNSVINGTATTWAFQWGFTRHVNSWLSIVPKHSLIMNIGLGEEATHTKFVSKKTKYNPFFKEIKELEKPLKIPEFVVADRNYDIAYYKLIYKSKVYIVLRKTLRFFLIKLKFTSLIKNFNFKK